MRFAKGHGTGNDFVILPDPDDQLSLTADLVAALCDRRSGIGGDGVLRVVRRGGEWFMDYWNADGSLAEMCGNGARVYARYLVSSGLAEPGRIPIQTRAGEVVAVVPAGPEPEGPDAEPEGPDAEPGGPDAQARGPDAGRVGAGREDAISVDMGLPKAYGESTATVQGRDYRGTAVDCGNPHLVCPVHGVSTVDALDLSEAPEVDPAFFPDGVNVEFFVPIVDLHVRMRVHERGVGETPSCGTGACAVAAVALRDAGLSTGTATVDVPGGRLTVTFDGVSCWLTGPAEIVATGEVNIPQDIGRSPG